MGLSRSFQITSIFHRLSVFENLRCALLWSMGYRYSFWTPLWLQRELTERTNKMLEDLNLAARRDTAAGLLSYADQRALEIGMTIAGGASVILLDEPTAGMSNTETDNAVELIRRISRGKTLVMVEHDMKVVFDLADVITVLVYGQVIASGPPQAVRANPAVQEAYLGAWMPHDPRSQTISTPITARATSCMASTQCGRRRDRQPARAQRRRPVDRLQGDHGAGRRRRAR